PAPACRRSRRQLELCGTRLLLLASLAPGFTPLVWSGSRLRMRDRLAMAAPSLSDEELPRCLGAGQWLRSQMPAASAPRPGEPLDVAGGVRPAGAPPALQQATRPMRNQSVADRVLLCVPPHTSLSRR